jgi:hypothetical protein
MHTLLGGNPLSGPAAYTAGHISRSAQLGYNTACIAILNRLTVKVQLVDPILQLSPTPTDRREHRASPTRCLNIVQLFSGWHDRG